MVVITAINKVLFLGGGGIEVPPNSIPVGVSLPPKTNMTKMDHEWFDLSPIKKLGDFPACHVRFFGGRISVL